MLASTCDANFHVYMYAKNKFHQYFFLKLLKRISTSYFEYFKDRPGHFHQNQ